MEQTEPVIILVTAPDREEAGRIARTLVEERLAACCNIIEGIESIYRWEGEVMSSREVMMMIKSTAELTPLLEQRVLDLHSYEVPEFIVIQINGGSQHYLTWLTASVTPPT